MTGFAAPNYTQVPNDFFEMAPDMGEAELRVVLCLIRATFGFHRERVQISIRELARQTGLTPRNAWEGAQRAEARGIVRASVSPGVTTEFECVVAGDTVALSLGIRGVSPGTAKLGVKERKRNPHLRDKEKRSVEDRLRAFLKEAGQ